MISQVINALIIKGISFRHNLVDSIVHRITGFISFSFQLSALSRRFLCNVFVVGILGLCLALIGCVAPAPTPPEPAAGKDTLPFYPDGVQPLKPEECGRCHPRFYNLIKTEGGKHRIDCKQCHVKFHIYRPGRVKYEDVLPKCSACHDEVHGADLAQCSECHTDAHTPMKIPARRALEEGCHMCHADVDREMKTYITQHTELYCSSCHHTKHRTVPECMECHRPHTEGMTQAECLSCHPPHKALQVVYAQEIPQEACAVCHRNAYEMLRQSDKKHSVLSCTKCHPEKHRAIVRCRECHGEPHPAAMHKKFRACGQCHGAAHHLTQ